MKPSGVAAGAGIHCADCILLDVRSAVHRSILLTRQPCGWAITNGSVANGWRVVPTAADGHGVRLRVGPLPLAEIAYNPYRSTCDTLAGFDDPLGGGWYARSALGP